MKTLNIIALVATALVALPTAAQAREVRVKIQRYELATLAGQKAVVDRINRAARRTCFEPGWSAGRQSRCTAKLGGEMIAQVGDPTLLALWKGQSAVASR